jgi:alpha-L-arabinofuranosidase
MLLCAPYTLLAQSGSITIAADRPGIAISPLFYGLMTEEINHAYDGGLYAELIRNRNFQEDAQQPVFWGVQGAGAQIALDRSQPLNPQRPISLKVTAPADGSCAITNEGYWGIPLRPNTSYKLSFYARASQPTKTGFHVSLSSQEGAEVFASATTSPAGTAWKQYTATLKTGRLTPSLKNRLVITLPTGGTYWFTQVSLFPPTYRNRKNGNRTDLMQLMAEMKPAFLRFPGGNYLEGNTFAERFDWKKTLGDPVSRMGHLCPWGYPSTDGMGLLEFLYWCEDLSMEPVLGVFAGYALQGEVIPAGTKLEPYVQDALEEIEYIIGDTKTKWGAVRAKAGHPKPFPLRYVEIGNEDWFDRSGSYDGRFAQFYDAIKKRYPHLQIIATMPVRSRTPDLLDDHYYRSARDMMFDWTHYDRYDRKAPKIFVGEWASIEGNPTPTHWGALGDAVWLMGLERNSDIVPMQCYAPLFVNLNRGAQQWSTNLIGYDALSSFGSPSYHVQALFAQQKGDVVLPANVVQPPAKSAAQPYQPKGAVGVGTWITQAEYKEMRVTQGDRVLYDGTQGIRQSDWKAGAGTWEIQGGVLRQTSLREDCRNVVGSPTWGDYTFTLKARKISGREGFLIMFHVEDTGNYLWWNIGGWGNSRTVIERATNGSKREIGNVSSATVEEGRWYDLRIEIQGRQIRCYIDGKLITTAEDTPPPTPNPIYATATRDTKTGDTILKVVNTTATAHTLPIQIQGTRQESFDFKAWTLQGNPTDQNTLQEPNRIKPISKKGTGKGSGWAYTFPAYSVSLLRIQPPVSSE